MTGGQYFTQADVQHDGLPSVGWLKWMFLSGGRSQASRVKYCRVDFICLIQMIGCI